MGVSINGGNPQSGGFRGMTILGLDHHGLPLFFQPMVLPNHLLTPLPILSDVGT